MKIAYTMAPGRGDTDLLLSRVARRIAKMGLRVCGTVQINSERETDGPCDMDVQVLPDGPIIRISQTLGAHSRGCRLDTSALEEAVGHVTREIRKGADVLVINKFGKHEAEGHGFRDVIADALVNDIPVLVGLNQLNLAAFKEFAGGLETELRPEEHKLFEWLEDNCSCGELV
ncbi:MULTISPECIES: DUF2478 domain-containing protein [unclassified Thalassospira]|uniref:DUF2478 domain-containing protein n=1 Tax=unclassified Thalassospira TaxID=2648997 RepID=UPI000ED3C6E8|nr:MULTISPECIES: DUF2478 domain-containing protein [unclassified Thalassospira]HAI29640.1 3-dehydroquinate dehydratase [Thalassospira sp.]|tara:strand:- start:860 stop:1378 length:519 start_codon:yes stop_codon:yes gene_type:complete